MSRIPMTSLLAAAACALAVIPAAASADGRGGGDREARAGGDVSGTVAKRIRRSETALDRAEERIDDGENVKAIAQLKVARRSLASAQKAAARRDDGSLDAVAGAQHRTIETVAGLFDGVTDEDVVSALDATLDAAIASRSTADADGVAEEREAIADALADDELTDAAKASLGDADAALQATDTTVAGDDEDAGDGPRGECRGRRGAADEDGERPTEI